MSRLTRRQFTGAVAGTALACRGARRLGRRARAETALRWFWWGNPERNKRTYAVVELYKQKHPDVAIEAETIGWDDYWPKMATQASGQNLADVVQMDYRYLFEYARRQQLEPLDDYIGNALDLSQLRRRASSTAAGSTASSTPCRGPATRSPASTTRTSCAELGITMPDHTWTWDDLRRIAGEIKKPAPESYWGVADKGHWEPMMEFFMRQRGKALYDEEGELGYDEEDVADYFGLWEGMRDEGLVPTPDDHRAGHHAAEHAAHAGTAAIDFAHSNQLVALQALNPHELGDEHVPEPAGRAAGAVSQALDADLDERRPARSRTRRSRSPRSSPPTWTPRRSCASSAACRATSGSRELLAEEADPAGEEDDRLSGDRRRQRLARCRRRRPRGPARSSKMLLRIYPELAFGRLDVADARQRSSIATRGGDPAPRLSADVDGRDAARRRRGGGRPCPRAPGAARGLRRRLAPQRRRLHVPAALAGRLLRPDLGADARLALSLVHATSTC